jgi:nuclear GTP-binding protein
MGKIRKKSSKRVGLKTKYTIQKKVKEHHRKIKKEAKKLNALGIKPRSNKKEGGIPNIYPYKEQLINSMERKENLDKERREQLKAM